MSEEMPDKSYGQVYWAAFSTADPAYNGRVGFGELGLTVRTAVEVGAQAVADVVRNEPRPAIAVTRLVDCRCGHRWCEGKSGVYRMVGACYNCGTAPVLGLFTVGHEAGGGDCPVCGCARLHWDRLATPDEVPADFEQHRTTVQDVEDDLASWGPERRAAYEEDREADEVNREDARDDDGERDTARRMDALDEAARLEAGL